MVDNEKLIGRCGYYTVDAAVSRCVGGSEGRGMGPDMERRCVGPCPNHCSFLINKKNKKTEEEKRMMTSAARRTAAATEQRGRRRIGEVSTGPF